MGVAAKLWLPTGPTYGFVQVQVDGGHAANISLYAPTPTKSSIVWQWQEPTSAERTAGGDADHAHAVTLRWMPPPPPPPHLSPPLPTNQNLRQPLVPGVSSAASQKLGSTQLVPVQERHPPFVGWVSAPGFSAVFGVPENGTSNARVLSNNVTTAAECKALCEANENCTMYVGPINYTGNRRPNQQHCWCTNCSWCTLCYGRTDLVWQLHPVAGTVSARRVAIPPPLPPSPPTPTPGQGQLFPVDVLEFLPAAALDTDQPPRNVLISNIVPRFDDEGEVLNAHDGAIVQDVPSGMFYLYGVSFNIKCTSDMYDNCVSSGPCGTGFGWVAYRSPDLVHWTLASSNIQPSNSPSMGDQARVLRNPASHSRIITSLSFFKMAPNILI